MSDSIEITFTPTVQDYAIAKRWITQQFMGWWNYLYAILIVFCAVSLSFCFATMLHVATHTGKVELNWLGEASGLGFIVSLVILFIVLGFTRRTLHKNLYAKDGIFLAQTTVSLSATRIESAGGILVSKADWWQVLGLFEDKTMLYIKLTPVYCLFIPKRIASAEDLEKLKAFIQKKISENAGKSTPTA